MRQMTQATVSKPVLLEDISIETGQIGRWSILPASQNRGIVFLRQLENLKVIEFKASYTNILHADGFVRVGNNRAGVNGVEHILSILHGIGITNAEILCETENPPENTSLFTSMILEAKTFQREPIDYMQYENRSFVYSDRVIEVKKSDRFRVRCEFNFASRHVPTTLLYSVVITPESYRDKICTARTFCTSRYLHSLHTSHRGLGASEKNCLVLEEDNENFELDANELVRHKILDFIGDVVLCGKPVLGDFYLYNPNHTTTYLFHQETEGAQL